MPELSAYYGLTLGTDVSVEELKNALGASEVRVALPDTPLTLDYIHSRITVLVDHDRVIKEIVWG